MFVREWSEDCWWSHRRLVGSPVDGFVLLARFCAELVRWCVVLDVCFGGVRRWLGFEMR